MKTKSPPSVKPSFLPIKRLFRYSPFIFLLPITIGMSFVFSDLSAQVPQGLNYQALAGDASGNPIRNTDIQVKISILSDTILPVTVWEELHAPIKTNPHGIFSLVVGSGTRQATSAVATFNEINWSEKPLFIKTQLYHQSVWRNMGSAKLWTVPYSMVAGDLSGSVKRLTVNGNTTALDEALFEVKNKDGQTVFAVYNEGVRINFDDETKGSKGGFAVGSFGNDKAPAQDYFIVKPDTIRMYIDDTPDNEAKGGFAIGGFNSSKSGSQNLLVVNSDSIRAYIDTNASKPVKGGFAVGGFSQSKSTVEEYLRVTRDSTRVYVNDAGKTSKGGFAVGGFGVEKTDASSYLQLDPDNYFIGQGAGSSNTTGLYNAFLGYQAGMSNTTGNQNMFFGYRAGYSNNDGFSNIFIGDSAGYENTSGKRNVFIGNKSGQFNKTGSQNIAVGMWAGNSNTTGNRNVFMGTAAGTENTEGTTNVFVGNFAGASNNTGNQNVFLGRTAGYLNTEGSNNVYVGPGAGNDAGGDNNVFLGLHAGWHEMGSNKLYIENTESDSTGALIYGEFDNDILRFNADVTISGNLHILTESTNLFLGDSAGIGNSGNQNTFLGNNAGLKNTTGYTNLFVGYLAGSENTDGSFNTFIGRAAGISQSAGSENTYLGTSAGYYKTSGDRNLFLGRMAGLNNTGGSGNVFIGYRAGREETGSERLYIENTEGDKDNALIYGEFDSNYLKFNALISVRDALILEPRSEPPDPAVPGMMYFDTEDDKVFVYTNGGGWHALW